MPDSPIDRLRRLRRKNETWQGGIVRFPRWLAEPGRKPLRPWMAFWISNETFKMNASPPRRPEEKSASMLLEAMETGQGMPGTRPSVVEVTDGALAEQLREMLAPLEIEVKVVERAPALDAVLQQLQRQADPNGVPSLLSVEGVTLERLRAFADAASAFYRAAQWQHLTDDDLIRIEFPDAPALALTHLTVLGAGGLTRGIGFYRSAEEHADLQAATDMRKFFRKHGPIWTVFFHNITQIPFADADLFEDHALPVAGEDAYPVPQLYGGADSVSQRPGADTLAHIEGVLRALAETSEGEMDTGRWAKRVSTMEGEKEYTFTLPALLGEEMPSAQQAIRFGPSPVQLRQMERALDRLQRVDLDQEFATPEAAAEYLQQNIKDGNEIMQAETPLEHAQDLVDQAAETKGRKSRILLRQALEKCPDCAEAYLLMAYREPDLTKAKELFEQAVAAGERSMEPGSLQSHAGEFWLRIDTRPYMKARMGLAELLRAQNRPEEAVTHFHDMLRLNPADHQGVRYRLMASLLDLKQDAALDDLFNRFEDDAASLWLYGKALWRFRREGDAHNARQAAFAALDANLVASNYLLKKKDLPAKPPTSYTPGSESEAVVIAFELKNAWESTPGAVYWLGEQRRKKKAKEGRR